VEENLYNKKKGNYIMNWKKIKQEKLISGHIITE
jgi:hypothetical protein